MQSNNSKSNRGRPRGPSLARDKQILAGVADLWMANPKLRVRDAIRKLAVETGRAPALTNKAVAELSRNFSRNREHFVAEARGRRELATARSEKLALQRRAAEFQFETSLQARLNIFLSSDSVKILAAPDLAERMRSLLAPYHTTDFADRLRKLNESLSGFGGLPGSYWRK
jgi:hypothetical protein